MGETYIFYVHLGYLGEIIFFLTCFINVMSFIEYVHFSCLKFKLWGSVL